VFGSKKYTGKKGKEYFHLEDSQCCSKNKHGLSPLFPNKKSPKALSLGLSHWEFNQ